jgi:transposase
LRYRHQLIEHRAPHSLHMQKALVEMNIQLTPVLTDITGVTGLAIIRAIISGERDPLTLARLRNPACKSSTDDIAKALTGTWREEHLFVLSQALAMFDHYTAHIAQCDAQLERQFSVMKPRFAPAESSAPLEAKKPRSKSKNAPTFNARGHLYRVLGLNLTGVMGLSSSLVLTILSEIGTDMSPWPTVKHFASWLGLAPRTISPGAKGCARVPPKTPPRPPRRFARPRNR